ncbi:MAG: TonB-dependent receptor [Longimicrobiales bacterium]
MQSRIAGECGLVMRAIAVVVGLVLASALAGPSAVAQQRRAEQVHSFDIPAGALGEALAKFSALTGLTVAGDVEALAGSTTSRALSGRYTAEEALRRMVFGTGIGFTLTGSSTATLHRQAVVLPGIRVVAAQSRGYRTEATRTGTKTETALRDIPQSLSIMTKQSIADQKMSGLADLVRYVPGVTMGQGEGNRDQPTIRGTSSTADFFVDGVRDDTEYFRDLYNVERVEIPKGSNALMFGRAAGGGLINRVTKQASWSAVQELMLQGGAHSNRRAELDVGRGLSDAVAGRVIGMYENSESYRQGYNEERWGVTPTATLTLGASTVVRASYELFKDDRTADRGVPSFDGGPLNTARSTFFGDPSVSFAHARVHSLNGTVEHQTSFGLQIRNHTRLGDYEKMYQNVFPGAVNAAGTEVSINAYNNRTLRQNLFTQTDVTAALRTGPIRHVLLAGAEVGRQRSESFRNTGFFNNTSTSVSVPVNAPSTQGTPVTFRQSATDADAHTSATVLSGYVQDQIEFAPPLLVVAGIRLDNFDLEYHNNRNGTDLERRDRMVSPRLGLIVKPVAPVSLYGSYSVSHLPGSGNQFTALTVTTQTLEPEQFTTYEAGAKWDPSPDLSLTAAVYQLDRTNTSAPDPTDPTRTVQTGSQRSKGLELSAAGRLLRNWQTLLGYNYQNVEITSRTANAQPGQQPALTPKHTLSLWHRYDLTPRLGVGLGLVHQDAMFAAIDNAVTLPSFTRADGALFFRLNEPVRAQLNVQNIFDEKYFASAHSNNNITPGAPRSLIAGVTITY